MGDDPTLAETLHQESQAVMSDATFASLLGMRTRWEALMIQAAELDRAAAAVAVNTAAHAQRADFLRQPRLSSRIRSVSLAPPALCVSAHGSRLSALPRSARPTSFSLTRPHCSGHTLGGGWKCRPAARSSAETGIDGPHCQTQRR